MSPGPTTLPVVTIPPLASKVTAGLTLLGGRAAVRCVCGWSYAMSVCWCSVAVPPARWWSTSCAAGLTGRSGRSRSSTRTTRTSTSPGSCSSRSARYRPGRDRQAPPAVHPRRRRAGAGRDRPGRRRPRTRSRWPTGASSATTTWSSRPVSSPRPDQTPGMLGPQWRHEHLRLLHPRRRDRPGRGVAGLRRRPARRAHRGHADQVPGRAAGVRVPGRGVLPRSAACATGSRSSTPPRCRARSPSRSPRRSSARCSTNARSPWRPTSWSSASTTTPRRWSPTTSGRSRSTCWSPCR